MEKKTVTKIVGAILTGGIGSVAGSIAGKMFKGKKIICTTLGVKFSSLAGKLLPDFIVCPIVCMAQKKKL